MSNSFNTISIIGLGYIGLPTAAVFASRKVKVIGVDVNPIAVDTINQGRIHIVEPDLDMLVHTAVTEGYLRATTTPEPADAFLIAVPTPFKEGPTGPHEPDLSYIEASCKSIAPVLKKGDLVILESTSPVGATEQVAMWLADARQDLSFPQTHGDESDIRVAHCPERVLPGKVLNELVQNDRVIGGLTSKCSEAAANLYKTFVRGECVITNARTAEMCKLTENSFRDVNIAFANELSVICNKIGIDVWELISLANRHPRVKILQPGPGVGGHCIAVDPWFIVSAAPEQAKLIHTARLVNDEKPIWVLEQFQKSVMNYLVTHPEKCAKEITVACFGLAFKPDIDDMRESPSMAIAESVARIHAGEVLIVEPNIGVLPTSLRGRAKLVSMQDAFAQANIVLLLVAHNSFKSIPKVAWNTLNIIDTCGLTCVTS